VPNPERYEVELSGGGRVTAVRYGVSGENPEAELVLAHGAGANQLHPFMVRMATALAERGVETTTFNFAYTEAGRRAPDPAPKLEACFRDVVRFVRGRRKEGARPLFLGGKSMGGRMASHLAAAGEPHLAGLVFLGYPLHPPGKTDKLRSEHLPRITVPMLFVQGTRDPFGTPKELGPILSKLPAPATVVAVEEGGHSFEVPKRAGTREDVEARVVAAVVAFASGGT
jgi:predicted alpha/beta-hydrolase family hydrolase